MKYHFPNIPKLKDLILDVENHSGRLKVQVSGPKAFFYRPLFKLYFHGWNRRRTMVQGERSNIYTLYVPPIPTEIHSRNLEGLLRGWLFRERTPLAVTIAVTSQCQLSCRHCSAAGRFAQQDSKPAISTEDIKRVIKESVDLGVTNITFTGGEPLMRKDLEECISAVPPEKAVCLVFTNALLLDAERASSLKAAGAQGVQISLDSPNAAEHDRLRQREGTFEAVKQGVRNALEAGLLVGLSTYASNDSVRGRSLAQLASIGAEWGVHEISVFDVIPTGRLLRNADVTLSKKSRRELLKEARRLNRKYRARPRIVTQSWTNYGSGLAWFIGCLAGNLQFHITAGGNFTPCDFTPLSFGNIRSNSVHQLWKKLIEHDAYRKRSRTCRMQSNDFRSRYIDPIPDGVNLPYPIDKFGD